MKVPRVGIGVIIKDGNKILLGKRKNAHGEGYWSFPGGHLEFGETIEQCAARELAEETGLILMDPIICATTNDLFQKEDKHYVTLFVQGSYKGVLENCEPHKCEGWKWFSCDELPDKLFLPIQNLLRTHTWSSLGSVGFLNLKRAMVTK